MDYHMLLDMVSDLGYRLAMSGAETFRVEESINRILSAYGVSSEVFSIPNCTIVSIQTDDGSSITRMRRIGFHGNDLDSVERYSNLCRRICNEVPEIETAVKWLKETTASRVRYTLPFVMLGCILGAAGYAVFFGGTLIDSLCAGFCGMLLGLFNKFMDHSKVNSFFKTIAASFFMAAVAYITGVFGIANNTDMVVIGTLMILVPGLIFTNAMRDIIFGDTNSGINRIVQVLLIAAAIALGTGVAWNLVNTLWGIPVPPAAISHSYPVQCLACFVGCIGFAILFNIHGPGILLCALGGAVTWAAYCLVDFLGGGDILCYFLSALVASAYSEVMARIRKYPAISYLCVSIFPLIPGAGIYYTTNHVVSGDMALFASRCTHTIAIAGVIAVGILMISTLVRLWNVHKQQTN